MNQHQVAIVHDYLTQRGGAERVVLEMAKALPGAPIFTSLYNQDSTFPEFADLDVRPSSINHFSSFRKDHRRALPVLAPSFSISKVHADVTLCSSSGWAHGIRATGRKVVYCHAPARWLYQSERYLSGTLSPPGFANLSDIPTLTRRLALEILGAPLRKWDQAAARSADVYLANSTVTAAAIKSVYGIDAAVIPPPPALQVRGSFTPVMGLEPNFWLCVSRLLPYKNVDIVIDAIKQVPDGRLVIVGDGPDRKRLSEKPDSRVTFLGRIEDDSLRWLYSNAAGIISASFEDYGLTPLEAAEFGKPAVVLRAGGFLDTVVEGKTGVFFDEPAAEKVASAIEVAKGFDWNASQLREHAEMFSRHRFAQQIRDAVEPK